MLGRLSRTNGRRPRAGTPADLRRGRAFASRVKRQLLNHRCDLIFAPVASWELTCVDPDLPTIYLSDTTARLHIDHYHEYEPPRTDCELEQLSRQESVAISKSTRLIYPSNWAAESAVSDYRADRRRIDIIPFGANVDAVPHRNEIPPGPAVRDHATCRLIFTASNWHRKGGDIAVDTLAELRRMGRDAELTLVGCSPTAVPSARGVTAVPYLSKNSPRQHARLNHLYLRSHFIIVPSRADCSPTVIGEANAFGVPAVCTNVGGIADVVSNGRNGYMLPADASGADFAARIAAVFGDQPHYERLARTARAEYDNRLNWMHWGDAVCRVMKHVNNGG